MIEEVVTVGTRAKPRSVLETPVPVDVISARELEDTGIVETSRALQFLAPSFNFSTSTVSDGTDIVRPSTLRGLNPDQTLVLVNGKRRHNSALMHVNGSIGRGTAGVDLNAIPASAIQRIEILRDGAAAQYGSDAIAGVINIVLKSQTEGTDVKLYTGQTYEGDGEQLQASVNTGFNIGNEGFFNLTAEYRDREATNRSGPDERMQFNFLEQQPGLADLQRSIPTDIEGNFDPMQNDGDPYCDPGVMDPLLDPFTLTPCTPDPREETFDRINHRYGDPDSENVYVFYNLEFPLTGDTEVYSFGGIARRDGESGGFYRRAEDARTVLELHPEGFLPLINTNVDDDSFGVGVRSRFGEWDADFSLIYGMNEFEFVITNSNNVSLGPTSPTTANAGTLGFDQTTLNIDFVRLVDWGWLNPVNVAVGFEWREDGYEIEAGDFASYANGPDDDPATAFPDQFGGIAAPGIQVFPGFRPANEVDENRDSVSAYADFETELTDQFLLGVAARFEDYSDFGSTVNGKVAGRYDFSDLFALRGSASTGFRAPSLHQQFFNNTSTQFVTVGGVPNVPTEVGTFNNDDPVTRAFGVPDLEEETSLSLSFGFTWTPSEEWDITADLYRIEIDDRVVLSGQFSAESADANGDPCIIGTGNCPIADILAPFPEVTRAQFLTNAIDTETTGLDLVVGWTRELRAGGALRVTGSANFTSTELDGAVQTPAGLRDAVGADQTLFNRQNILWLEEGQPENHINLAINYQKSAFSGTLRFNRFGEVKSSEDFSNDGSSPELDQTFGAKTLTDLDLTWAFDSGLSVSVGGTNIFDEIPDKNIDVNSFGGIFPFNRRTTPFGFNGGAWYAVVSYAFEH